MLNSGSGGGLSANSAVTVGQSSYLDMNGLSSTIASLAGNGYVMNYVVGTATLTIGGNSTTTFSGAIVDQDLGSDETGVYLHVLKDRPQRAVNRLDLGGGGAT